MRALDEQRYELTFQRRIAMNFVIGTYVMVAFAIYSEEFNIAVGFKLSSESAVSWCKMLAVWAPRGVELNNLHTLLAFYRFLESFGAIQV